MPERRRFGVHSVDHQGTTANELGCRYAALEGVLHQARSDPAPSPADVGCKLTQEQTRYRIRQLAGSDRAGQDVRNDTRRCETIIADNASGLMDDQNGREAFLLVGKRTGLQPMVECRLSRAKIGDVVGRR